MTSNNSPSLSSTPRYNHQRYEATRRVLRFLLKYIGFTLLAKLDRVEGLEHVPSSGPGILMINHIAFIDPFIVLHTLPRNLVPMAKIEVYNYPGIGIFPRLWGVIPVRREEFDRRAVQKALDVLHAGELILVAPEATRSPQLQRGKEGVAYLSLRSGAPIIPAALEGTIGFPTFWQSRRWRGPGAVVKFGRPFRFRSDLKRPSRQQMRQMTDEAMYILARLLPEHRRGVYADLSQATEETIDYML
jgi:1-acyl-sn-glycerol-3-phosphate acyltransferase